jgi:hypothetical protein
MSRSNLQQPPLLNNPTSIVNSKRQQALNGIGLQLPLQSVVLGHQPSGMHNLVNLPMVKNR